ncbi:hypothetical protein CPT_MarsHill_213 [Staphylococcus phage MarsHill]|nr:hypothetical protein CPT_MarsHill_213 [Staphylococcus phage MarsHill]
MVKKIDWKYTIVKQFVEDVKVPYTKFLDSIYNSYIKEIGNKDIEFISSFNDNYSYLLEDVNSLDDSKDLIEMLNYIDNQKIVNSMTHSNVQLLGRFRNLYFHIINNDGYKDPEKLYNDLKYKDRKAEDVLKELDKYEVLDRILYNDGSKYDYEVYRSKIFTDKDDSKVEFYKRFNSFKDYDLLKNFIKDEYLANAISILSNKEKITLKNMDVNIFLTIGNGSFRFDITKEQKDLLNEIKEIFLSYQYLLNTLKEKSIKGFGLFIEKELPKLKLEEFDIRPIDMLDKDFIKNDHELMHKKLSNADKMIKLLELV